MSGRAMGFNATHLFVFLHVLLAVRLVQLWIFVNSSAGSWFSFDSICACEIEWRSMNKERPPSLAAVQPPNIPALGRAFRLLLTDTNMGMVRHFRSKINIKLEICGKCLHEVLSLTGLQSERRQRLWFNNMLNGVEFI